VSVVDNDAPITIDNGGTGTSFTGTWLVSAGLNPQGSTSLYAGGSGQDTYRWTPTIPTARLYDVYAWWTTYSNRSANVQYRIVRAGGTTVTTRDQRTGGGQWQHLGTFQFNAGTGGYVQLSDINGSTVSADAVLFAPR
jgi:hyaluronate lyase